VHTFKIGDFGLITGLDKSLEPGLDQGGQAAAKDYLLTEQVGFSFFLKGRLNDTRAGTANTVGPG